MLGEGRRPSLKKKKKEGLIWAKELEEYSLMQ
jgi:hypothetical protein